MHDLLGLPYNRKTYWFYILFLLRCKYSFLYADLLLKKYVLLSMLKTAVLLNSFVETIFQIW